MGWGLQGPFIQSRVIFVGISLAMAVCIQQTLSLGGENVEEGVGVVGGWGGRKVECPLKECSNK